MADDLAQMLAWRSWSGVVDVYRLGKARNYSLNPEPLRRIHDGWLANFGDMQARSLAALRKRVDSGTTHR